MTDQEAARKIRDQLRAVCSEPTDYVPEGSGTEYLKGMFKGLDLALALFEEAAS